ncbi:MAG: PDZ domain-containing protein, partial [bacterium]|nr:PDZ domain-containing protein [bacterium]
RLPLEKFDKHFRSAEFDKLFIEKKDNKKEKNKKKDKTTAKADKTKKREVFIDFHELTERWEQVSPRAGTQRSPYVTAKENGDGPAEYNVLYLSNHDGERFNVWQTTYKPFEPAKTQKIKGAATYALKISESKGNYYLLVGGKIGTLNLKANQFKPIDMKFTFRRDPGSEFKQMFFETWASLRENFYDEKFHGIDWDKVRKRYAQFLPHIRSRANLRTLIADMLGELNASHLGFNSRGDEEKTFHRVRSKHAGLIFENGNPGSYIVKSIVTGSPADKKGIDIKPGDELTAVNNRNADPALNRESYFAAPSIDKELELTFKRKSENKTFTVKIHPVGNRTLRGLLYDEWIRNNQRVTDEKSSRRIAYIHMKDMGRRELENFLIEMTTESYKREGLILDLRYNRGGNVHDEVLNFLSRRPYTLWKYRGGKFAPQPNFAPSAKPIVLLINRQSLSDAEMTAAGFKELKMGTVIGTETYRWLIFTTGKGLVDGSYYRLPSWGCYTLDKKDIEIHGVKPDIYIKNTFKDRLEGKDPQLEGAINHILERLK